jgi:hypothetical protein
VNILEAPAVDTFGLKRHGLPSLEHAASPAAGADFTKSIDSAYPTRLLTVFCRLVTDANVANREVVVEYRDIDGNRFYPAGAPVVVTASTTTDYSFQAGLGQPDWPIDSTILVPLQPFLLVGSWSFRLHVVNVQVTDQLSRIRWVQEQYLSQTG